ncbi:hypothetical protein N8077_05495 [Myxococcota bacterium]|nr:hypothetical protein [Myxococcota bacterium]
MVSSTWSISQRSIVYCVCFLTLECFSFINSFVVDLKGASIDAAMFQEQAAAWVDSGSLEFVTDADFYIQFLGSIYYVFGSYEFIGAQFSIVALMVAAVYFERILRLFDVYRAYRWVLPFLFLPSLLTRATTTMREPYLIMCLVLIAYYLTIAERRSGAVRNSVLAIAWGIAGALFHKAFAVFLVFLVPYALRARYGSILSPRIVLRLALLTGALLAGLFVVNSFSNLRGLLPVVALLEGDTAVMERIIQSKSSREFRTTYDTQISFSSPASFIVSYPNVFVHYQFQPFPWQVSNGYDLYAALEGALRFIGFFILLRIWLTRKRTRRGMTSLTVLLFLLSSTWAAGTANYGTASRHHTTTNWIFIAAYAVYFTPPTRRRRAVRGQPTDSYVIPAPS